MLLNLNLIDQRRRGRSVVRVGRAFAMQKHRNRLDSLAKARPPNELPLDPQEDNHLEMEEDAVTP